MSQLAIDLIKDCTERIKLAMREGRFTKEELELLTKLFETMADITRKTLGRGPST